MKAYANVQGGQQIAQRLNALRAKLERGSVAVGLPADAGTHPTADMSYARLGAIHEFGAPKAGIPERSFLRVPLRANQDQIKNDFKRLLKMVLDEKLTITAALNQIGARGASISQEAISKGVAPPNTAATKKRKGSSTPLMDTGALRRAITWVVEGEAEE